ncbi:dihydrofolate reductase family protein [Pelagerythrobacter marensis]|uniref:Dihydrofolate reductase n=1 Tax=Pelagerythrobacter marensis TaxID=543877 RepID=A0A0G3X6K7_9SPHN|nr:dihydrofolate reductase family protein [Pelagerythrobacter marensis]AKM07175.1 dihydrofolate reductase [Pelagerythrobacter marensis]
MGRRIIGGAFISLDGIIQAPGGPEEDTTGGFAHGGWLANLFEEAIANQIDTLLSMPFDLLLGRRTYDIFAGHWPHQPQDDPIADMFARAHKYVLTGSDQTLDWEGSHRLADLDSLAALKRQDGPDLVIQGSSTLYPQLLEHNLLDRLVLMTAPLTLGTGKRLFGDGTPVRKFRLVEQRLGTNGSVMSTYEPNGALETGSFASQQPSEAEIERRRKMAEGTW